MEVLLERCPFCGSEARPDEYREVYEKLVADNGRGCIYVECSNRDCGAMMYAYGEPGESYESLAEKAIQKWNRRAANV